MSKVADLQIKGVPAAPRINSTFKDKGESATPAVGRSKKSPLILKQDQVGAPRAKHPPRTAGGGPADVAPPRVVIQALKQGVAKSTRRVRWLPQSSRGSPTSADDAFMYPPDWEGVM
jgi:hypothetical protein